jgi:predicted nucleic acid-binding protein
MVVRTAGYLPPLNLDPGETEAIVLAKELHAFAVLLDDGEARRKAQQQGLHVTGTVGILERAAAANLVDLPAIVAKLRTTTFHASPEILQAALARDAARKQ